MLRFCRRYQQYFFIIIAVVVVVSFSFFGTHYAVHSLQKVDNHPIGIGIDGSKLMRREIDEMVRFLWSDCNDVSLIDKNMMPNFFNDGVIKKDLFESGIGIMLIETYFNELKEEFTERITKHKRFRPYRHPKAPFISVEHLWEQLLPSQKIAWERFIQEREAPTLDTLNTLIELYLGEQTIPSHLLREYLLVQQRHYKWIEPDPELRLINLNMFHCHTLEDWFGPRFLELSAQFISNVALLAKQRGYKVSYEEARIDLIHNGYEALKKQQQKETLSGKELSSLWSKQLHYLNMDEKDAVHVWQKIMLFRRLFEEAGGAVFMDPHIYQTFHEFTSKVAEVDLYQLPKYLEMKDFFSVMKFEFYLDAIAKEGRDLMVLPKEFASVQEIEEKYPELVQERFLVEVSEVCKENIALNVSIKEMWKWQLEKENYESLEKNFPILAAKKAQNVTEYFHALESLHPKEKQKVNHFSRKKIVDTHPEWIDAALNESRVNKQELSFSRSEKYLPLGFSSAEPLRTLLSQSALKRELERDSTALDACKQLERFSLDGETYYRFQVLDRDLNKTVLTFSQANEKKILDALLEKHLEKAYVTLRDTHPTFFKTENGEWKTFKDVQAIVGSLVYSNLLKAIRNTIEQEAPKVAMPDDLLKNLDLFYPKYLLYTYMRSAYDDIRHLGAKSSFLLQPMPEDEEEKLATLPPLETQWGVIKRTEVLKHHEKSPWITSDVFSMAEHSWSDITLYEEQHPSFFQLKKKSPPSRNFSTEMKQGRAILSKEAKKLLMQEILDLLKTKRAVHIV